MTAQLYLLELTVAEQGRKRKYREKWQRRQNNPHDIAIQLYKLEFLITDEDRIYCTANQLFAVMDQARRPCVKFPQVSTTEEE